MPIMAPIDRAALPSSESLFGADVGVAEGERASTVTGEVIPLMLVDATDAVDVAPTAVEAATRLLTKVEPATAVLKVLVSEWYRAVALVPTA